MPRAAVERKIAGFPTQPFAYSTTAKPRNIDIPNPPSKRLTRSDTEAAEFSIQSFIHSATARPTNTAIPTQ